ncbi:GAF domain-containing sensor histidine kinase [Actinoplanes subglobosus]|uniref:Sensor-like histidine kinase SenX3 n=1 Tax=Actinoplanes subglobosus TaxID=1547892 RepID=A0ABV8IJW7_9ACTN
MLTPAIERPDAELQRLAALHEYQLLDAPADDELSAVVRVAAMIADVPTATLNLIDENRQCQLTTVGFPGSDSDRSDSMCDVAFRDGQVIHLPDARQNPLYSGNPWVDGRMANVRFYASAPLISPAGYALGTLCVFDEVVKALSRRQIQRLEDLAEVIVGLFERRRQARISAELALETERSHKFIETLLDTVDVGIAAADADGRLTVLNRAVRRWAGAAEDLSTPLEILATRCELLHLDGLTPVSTDETPLHQALRDHLVNDVEFVLRTADHSHLTVTANSRNILTDAGDRIGAVVALTDVTRDREHRQAIERAHAELRLAVSELERSNDELEGFAAAVSHDLVRPLASASGFLEMFGQVYGEQLDERGAKWVTGAGRALDRMQQLVKALLDYARAGHAPYQAVSVDLNEVLAQVRADLRAHAESAGATITVGGPLPSVEGDPTLLRQLLQNLIDNAIKYRRPDRAPAVEVTCERGPDGCVVAVADNGLGIPPEHRDRVFDMFAQVDPESRKGHGIGLSTCMRIVERHGGRITVGESPSGGTVIRLHLPATDCP